MAVAFKLPRFYPILDTAALAARNCTPMDAAKGLIDAGARILQYRHKESWTQREFDEAAGIRTLCHDEGILFVLNDRADFAKILGAALHVGQNDLSPLAARKVVGDEVMGLSTHNRRQLVYGDEAQVEYLSLGPIFSTNSKLKPDPVVGVEGLRTLKPLTKKPLVAIGGITLRDALSVIEAGADAVAVISAALPQPCTRKSVKQRAKEWLEGLAENSPNG